MAQKLKITYLDGRSESVIASPKAQVMTERHFGMALADTKSLEHMYYLAWAAAHYAGREGDDFETFLGKIEDVDQDAPETDSNDPLGAVVVPTVTAPTPGGLSDSASPPESPSMT